MKKVILLIVCAPALIILVATSWSAEWIPNGNLIDVDEAIRYNGGSAVNSQDELLVCWNEHADGIPGIRYRKYDTQARQAWENDKIIAEMNYSNLDPFVATASDDGWFVLWRRIVNRDWQGPGYSTSYNLRLQRLDRDGNQIWEADEGVPLTTVDTPYPKITLLSGRSNDAFVIFSNSRAHGDVPGGYIKAIHVLDDGNLDPQWPEGGVTVLEAPVGLYPKRIVLDRDDNLLIPCILEDKSTLVVQKVNRDGQLAWRQNLILSSSAYDIDDYFDICTDHDGGLIAAWREHYVGNHERIGIQHVSSDGQFLLDADGAFIEMERGISLGDVQLVSADEDRSLLAFSRFLNDEDEVGQGVATLISTENDTLHFVWDEPFRVIVDTLDQEPDIFVSQDNDDQFTVGVIANPFNADAPKPLYLQHLDIDGRFLWNANPLHAADIYREANILTVNGSSHWLVWSAWDDFKSGIRLQQIDEDGNLQFDVLGDTIREGNISQDIVSPNVVLGADNNALVMWSLYPSNPNPHLQVVTPDGGLLYPVRGIPISPSIRASVSLKLLPDGTGNAIAVWMTYGGIAAQKVGRDGSLWDNGLRFGSQIRSSAGISTVGDNSGGCYVAMHHREGQVTTLFGYHLGNDGEFLWDSAGVNLSSLGGAVNAMLVREEGGFYVVWNDGTSRVLRAGGFDADGQELWNENETAVKAYQRGEDIRDVNAIKTPDGIAITYLHRVADYDSSLFFLQFLDFNGQKQWGESGQLITATAPPDYASEGTLLPAENGNFLLGWRTSTNSGSDIMLQKFDSEGNRLLEGDPGKVLYHSDLKNSAIVFQSDGNNGFYLLWSQTQSLSPPTSYILATHIDTNGDVVNPNRWGNHGRTIVNQRFHRNVASICSDGQGGCYAVVGDGRANGDDAIYLIRINDEFMSVELPQIRPISFSFSAFPNPFNSSVTISFSSSLSSSSLRIYDISGRLVTDLTTADPPRSAGMHKVIWDATSVGAGVYFVRLEAGEEVRTEKIVLIR